MAQPFNVMYDLLLPYLPGVDKPILDSTIRKAAREFLKRTTLIRETFAFTSTPPAVQYQLNATQGQVSSILHVYAAGEDRPLEVATEADRARRDRPAARPMWWSPLPTILELVAAPEAPTEFTVVAVITLPQDATMLPDGLHASYGEILSMGVLSLMYAMPGKPWTSGDAAKTSGRGFSQEIKSLRGRLRDGGQPNQSTFSPTHKFGK